MKISELIAVAQAVLAEHGDLKLFDNEVYPISYLSLEDGDEFDSDWDMPNKFIQINSAK